MFDEIDNTAVARAAGGAGGSSLPLSQSQSDELRESFLRLLTTQLQNQDPLNPLENAEMTSQIAQINTVSGIEQLNDTLKLITGQIDANQALQASALVGKGVMVPGDRVLLEQDEEGEVFTTPFGIELDEPAENVQATITDAGGRVVSQLDLGAVDAGVSSFNWDGMTAEGEVAAPGAYSVTFEAIDADEESLNTETLNYAQVGGVTPQDQDGNVKLDLGAIYGQVGLDDIRQIL
ncbi:flagellar hook assembly protein FlgD [Halochromatium salexigens]|uniref:Basal-body rod modification protein FlgD n=1 Tax=Halochromatium salexigens TaxID=49447 RepID=A0AAJ0XF23_HALSE|nr:flagellar hook assembly protein FlgD [Halochromatium salexigens]MBK5929776.1 flagellar basal body rod modification protein [Halochromatium salexigens]